jgi:hypothetical protein
MKRSAKYEAAAIFKVKMEWGYLILRNIVEWKRLKALGCFCAFSDFTESHRKIAFSNAVPEVPASTPVLLTLYSVNCVSVVNEAQHLHSRNMKINILFVRM